LVEKNSQLFIEFKENSMHVLDGEHGIDIPIERDGAGRIPSLAIESVANQLRAFFDQTEPSARMANCAIPARGVSVRRITLPSAAGADIERVLTLQLEAQMPVAPSELAWGCARLPGSRNGNVADLQEFLVIAVKRELLSDYTAILAGAGVTAHFTLAAVARRALCTASIGNFSILDLSGSGTKAEFAAFEHGEVLTVRALGPSDSALNGSLQSQLGQKLYLTGQNLQPVAERLAQSRPNTPVEIVDGFTGPGRTAANLGFKKLLDRGEQPMLLGAHEAKPRITRPTTPWKWAALAALLAVVALSLRYAEAIVYRTRLSRKLAAISAYRNTLPKIEREYNFLNFIKTNQPPYLDTFTVLAQAVPAGTRIDTLSLLRNGDLTLRGTLGDAQGPGTFRSKLIDSGFFSRVVVDEQTPIQDGQKFTFRLSAQLKPDGARKPLSLPTKPTATNALETAAPKPGRN
jgi:hypothetical protein